MRKGETSALTILFLMALSFCGGIAVYHFYGDDVSPKVEGVIDQAEAAKDAWQEEGDDNEGGKLFQRKQD